MHPSSNNTMLSLLTISSKVDKLGNKKNIITNSHQVYGTTKSITTSEYNSAVMMNVKYDRKVLVQAFLYKEEKYALIQSTIFKIERTFMKGQFLELYMASTDLKYEDLIDE
ncbi:MAG: hypothetical protein K2N64_05195 [Anaeroplasmataceae bacterium]|nr:hypothetical protein [Anaeroplasmataceae bacterium]